MSWDRDTASAALVELFSAALPTVKIHAEPPKMINPPCVVVSDANVTYNNANFCSDTAELPCVIVGGTETTRAVEDIKSTCRAALESSPDLGGVVQYCRPTSERNWRNYTGAGGIQLLTVELVLEVKM